MQDNNARKNGGPSIARKLLNVRYEEYIAMVAMVIVVGSVVWGVLTRYLFPQPAPWSYEVATIAFAWLVFFAAAAGVRHRLHSDIDVFVLMFPASAQRALAVFNFWLLALFFATLTVLCAIHTVDAQKSTTIALNIPRSFIYAPLCLAAAMMLVRHVQIWRDPAAAAAFQHEANIT
jgi:TRAP-type C4-dicarboxylate transport system permease small subunit